MPRTLTSCLIVRNLDVSLHLTPQVLSASNFRKKTDTFPRSVRNRWDWMLIIMCNTVGC